MARAGLLQHLVDGVLNSQGSGNLQVPLFGQAAVCVSRMLQRSSFLSAGTDSGCTSLTPQTNFDLLGELIKCNPEVFVLLNDILDDATYTAFMQVPLACLFSRYCSRHRRSLVRLRT